MADNIVQAACALHNYLRTKNSQEIGENYLNSNETQSSQNGLSNIEIVRRNHCQDAVREKFKEYFPEGQLPWQMDIIRQGRIN
jgi:hypothetical protein